MHTHTACVSAGFTKVEKGKSLRKPKQFRLLNSRSYFRSRDWHYEKHEWDTCVTHVTSSICWFHCPISIIPFGFFCGCGRRFMWRGAAWSSICMSMYIYICFWAGARVWISAGAIYTYIRIRIYVYTYIHVNIYMHTGRGWNLRIR